MENVDVKIKAVNESSYPILIDDNLLDNIYEYIKYLTEAKKFLVVTNKKVFDLYGNKLKSDFAKFILLPDGEEFKNRDVLNTIIDRAFEIKLERQDAIIALGGGVIGDMAGLAASLYLRGVDFIQIPTTLLAQVDSSVGGKVAVNHKHGKNVIGAFYQPKLVAADTNTLNTLDIRQYRTGLAEVLKYAFIEKTCSAPVNYHLLEFLIRHKEEIYNKNPEILKQLIKICCLLKSSVVNIDEKEKGLRAILNLGHTYAHAIEMITDYKLYTHGEAVSIGLKLIFDLAKNLGTISSDYYNCAVNLLKEYNLVTELSIHYDKEIFYEAMLNDKKVKNKEINLVIPIGEKEVKIYANIDKNLILKGI